MSDAESAGEWITVQEAAKLCDVSERTVRRWASDNKVASRKERGRLLVAVADLDIPSPDLAGLDPELVKLRSEVEMLRTIVQDKDEQIEFLRTAVGAALQLQAKAIEQPKPRRFRWPWERDD